MIDQRKIETAVVEGLQKELDCLVICANQTAKSPAYPYLSYTITSPKIPNGGTWGNYGDGIRAKQVTQIWSFTAQSNADTESQVFALKAHDWFDQVGTLYLNDNHIVVKKIENITNRDNFLTIEYEYRNGFDVHFSLMDSITIVEKNQEYISTAELKKDIRKE